MLLFIAYSQAPIKASEKPPELQLITLQQQNAVCNQLGICRSYLKPHPF